MKSVNWIGLVVALVAGQIFGIVWYGNLFSAAWAKAMGLTEADFVGQEWRMALGVVNMLLILLALDFAMRRLGTRGWLPGAKLGLFVGLFFGATVSALNYIYAAGPLVLLLIDGGYQVVSYALLGALLGGLRRAPKAE